MSRCGHTELQFDPTLSSGHKKTGDQKSNFISHPYSGKRVLKSFNLYNKSSFHSIKGWNTARNYTVACYHLKWCAFFKRLVTLLNKSYWSSCCDLSLSESKRRGACLLFLLESIYFLSLFIRVYRSCLERDVVFICVFFFSLSPSLSRCIPWPCVRVRYFTRW